MAKVKEAPKKDEKKVKAKVVKAAEIKNVEKPASEMTFEEKLEKNEDFQLKKRELKSQIEAKKKEIGDLSVNAAAPAIMLTITVIESKLRDIQAEERKWLMSFAKMLEPEIKKNGFIYKLVKRGEKTLIYGQYNKMDAEDGGGISETPIAYEVFLSKISAPKIAFKKPYDAYEMFPGNGVFGIWAWTFTTLGGSEQAKALEKAEKCFNGLEQADVIEIEVEAEVED